MKKIYSLISSIVILALVSCSPSDIIINDFESGDYGAWTIEGDAFGTVPATGAYPGQQDVKGFEGKYLANSFNGGDDSRGTLTSPEFTIERDYINYLLGGGKGEDLYIELIVDGASVYKTHSVVDTETLYWMTWDVANYKGKKAVIKIVDNQRGEWGHILVDQIGMSNNKKSTIMAEYKMSFDVDKKYLLIPIEDDGPESIVSLEVDGKIVSNPAHIRVAQTQIDYWVPMDVEKYKGQKLNLCFDHVKNTDIGFAQIQQSDSFDFDYNEKFRPHYHFSPLYGWMNDPNGMVYKDGEYHLFFQHNLYGSRWANMSWGHATSKDLVKWERHSDAITQDSLGSIFSGSAVIDKHNTAGFGANAIVAIYTSAGKIQTQSIAYSLDNGRTFTKYNNNPVLSNPEIADFRDPKVFWHDASKQWILSLATQQTITFYGSKDLKEWNRLSEFGEGLGGHGGVWECPDLFTLTYNGQTKWILFVSINPGGPNGGNATQYFIGNFDGKTFTPDKMDYPLWLDYGRDNYAGVTWSNAPDNRKIFIGWMSNWDYANYVPTVNFRAASTVPRELRLVHNGKHLVVANYPVKEIDGLRADKITIDNITVDNSYTIDKLLATNDGAYEIEMTVKVSAAKFGFKLQNKANESLDFLFDLNAETLIIDRSNSGNINFNTTFAPKPIKAPLVKKDEYKIRLLMDKASSELFVNTGELVQTNIIFPSEPYNIMVFESEGGTVNIENMNIYNFK